MYSYRIHDAWLCFPECCSVYRNLSCNRSIYQQLGSDECLPSLEYCRTMEESYIRRSDHGLQWTGRDRRKLYRKTTGGSEIHHSNMGQHWLPCPHYCHCSNILNVFLVCQRKREEREDNPGAYGRLQVYVLVSTVEKSTTQMANIQ